MVIVGVPTGNNAVLVVSREELGMLWSGVSCSISEGYDDDEKLEELFRQMEDAIGRMDAAR